AGRCRVSSTEAAVSRRLHDIGPQIRARCGVTPPQPEARHPGTRREPGWVNDHHEEASTRCRRRFQVLRNCTTPRRRGVTAGPMTRPTCQMPADPTTRRTVQTPAGPTTTRRTSETP